MEYGYTRLAIPGYSTYYVSLFCSECRLRKIHFIVISKALFAFVSIREYCWSRKVAFVCFICVRYCYMFTNVLQTGEFLHLLYKAPAFNFLRYYSLREFQTWLDMKHDNTIYHNKANIGVITKITLIFFLFFRTK